MVGNCEFNIRANQEAIKLISGVSRKQRIVFRVVDLITAVCIYKHNLKDLYLPSEYIVNIKIGTIYLKLYLMGLGQKADFCNGKMLCKNVFQETGNIGHFCWALLKINVKDWYHVLKKPFFRLQNTILKARKYLHLQKKKKIGVVPVDLL